MMVLWLNTWRIFKLFDFFEKLLKLFSQLKGAPFKIFYSLFFEQCSHVKIQLQFMVLKELSILELILKYSRTLGFLSGSK